MDEIAWSIVVRLRKYEFGVPQAALDNAFVQAYFFLDNFSASCSRVVVNLPIRHARDSFLVMR